MCIFTNHILTTRVIIYFIDVLDSLGNYIYILIDYNPLLGILGDKIHCHKCKLDFKTHLKLKPTDYLYLTFYKIEL